MKRSNRSLEVIQTVIGILWVSLLCLSIISVHFGYSDFSDAVVVMGTISLMVIVVESMLEQGKTKE